MFIAIPALFIAIGVFDAMTDTPAPIVEPEQASLVTPEQMISVGYQPSGWSCNGTYVPMELIRHVEFGTEQGLHLKNPNDPSFNYYISCANLVDIYG